MNRSRVNWFYVFISVLLCIMLFVSARYFRGNGVATIGLAATQDYKINSEKPTLVKAVHAVPGQQVKEGDLLIELSSQELDVKIAQLSNQITTLKLERVEKSKLALAQISYIQAQNSIIQEELDAELLQAQSQVKMNDRLSKEFVPSSAEQSESPLLIKIKSLQEQKKKQREAAEIKIKDVKQIDATEQYVLGKQIELQENELRMLKETNAKLNKYAIGPGVIQNVLVKAGEQVSPFTPLMTINPQHPSMVIVYQVGTSQRRFEIGQEVTVSHYDRPSLLMKGKVIGYGSVMPLPDILQKSTAVKAFGQEVFIELPADNQLANGEKVLVR